MTVGYRYIYPKSRNSSFRPASLDRTIFSRHSEENSTTPCWVPRCRRLWRVTDAFLKEECKFLNSSGSQ